MGHNCIENITVYVFEAALADGHGCCRNHKETKQVDAKHRLLTDKLDIAVDQQAKNANQ